MTYQPFITILIFKFFWPF